MSDLSIERSVRMTGPAVLFSSFRQVPQTFAPLRKVHTAPGTSQDNSAEDICAEMPKQRQLQNPIWSSLEECPEDFWEREFEVDKRPGGDASGSPGSPVFSDCVTTTSPFNPVPLDSATSVVEDFTTPPLIEMVQALPARGTLNEELHKAWLGTNVTIEAEWTMAPSRAMLEDAISRRSSIETIVVHNPYDPQGWLELANIYFELCFNDLQVASAHKAMFLAGQGLDATGGIISREVRRAVEARLTCRYEIVVVDELESELLEAHKALLRGLFEMCAYWEGLKQAKNALGIFPGNEAILHIQRAMKDEFCSRTANLGKCNHSAEDRKALSRIGRSFKRKYPWLDDKLFARSPALLKEINAKFNSANCDVCPLFPSYSDINVEKQQHSHQNITKASMQPRTANPTDTEANVGPLGVFAKRKINKDEILLIDHNFTIVPVSPRSAKLQHCDACQALLIPPFMSDGEKKFPPCCKDVAYCSVKCATTALNSWHKLICGKDFKWLYRTATSLEHDPSWQPLALLRILAIVVSDLKAAPASTPSTGTQTLPHPLQHPLLARISAGYETSPTHATSSAQVWNYFSHVVAPTRILAQLGVDIFADTRWSAEVIHTIYWRIVNNACRASSCTIIDESLERTALAGISPGYIFFNHSCSANVAWMAAGSAEGAARIAAASAPAAAATSSSSKQKRKTKPAGSVNKDIADGVRVGCNAMVCFATRDIKKGEEARISYLPPGKRQQLRVWFEGGKCMCGTCGGDGNDTQEATA